MRYVRRHTTEYTEEERKRFEEASGLGRVAASLLMSRGVRLEELPSFLHPREEDLLSPFSFRNMNAVCERIHRAIQEQQRITVYSDYDADGTCGCALFYQCLKALGARVDCYIPDRFCEGYGTNEAAIRRLCQGGAGLIITVDCGIRSVNDVAVAKQLGVDVIILDHHECGELPDTPYIVNPKLPGEIYKNKSICGCGVAFQTARALMGDAAMAYIDLAGVATIGDIVSLRGENRAIAWLGIEKLRRNPSLGLKCLAQMAGMDIRRMDSYGVSFGLVPRINAAGRMEHAKWALSLLLAREEGQAMALAEKICAMNAQRQAAQKRVSDQVIAQVAEEVPLAKRRIIMAAGEDFAQGVVGLAASAVAGRFCRPTVIFAEQEGILVGSARSLENVDIYDALNQCAGYYLKFGGHSQAAGLSMKKEDLAEVNDKLDAYLKAKYEDECFLPRMVYDQEIEAEEITLELTTQLDQLEPFGQDNPAPVFLVHQRTPEAITYMGKEKQHLKFAAGGADFVYFRYPEAIEPGADYAFCGSLGKNSFQGRTTPQFIIQSAQRLGQRGVTRDTFLRQLPAELHSFSIFWTANREAMLSRDEMEAALRKCLQRSAFGSAIVINSQPGWNVASKMNLENIQYICIGPRPWSAENCLLLRAPEEAALKNYENIFAIGAFAYQGKNAGYLFDESMVGEYIDIIGRCVGDDMALTRLLEATRAVVGETPEWERLSQFASACARRANTGLEEAWVALNIFFGLKLIEVRKSDKIQFIDKGIEADFAQSALYSDLRRALREGSR